MNSYLWKDGILLMLRLSNLASQQGEREVALSLLVTSVEALASTERKTRTTKKLTT